MHIAKKNVTLGSVSGIGLLVLSGFILSWTLISCVNEREHLSDNELISSLNENIEHYTSLVTMFRDDAPLSIAHPIRIHPRNSIFPQRWQEYKRLFNKLKIEAGMRRWQEESIWFISSTQSLASGASSKGLMYQPKSPSPLYNSLDEHPKDLNSNVKGYRKINEDWYIVYDWDD